MNRVSLPLAAGLLTTLTVAAHSQDECANATPVPPGIPAFVSGSTLGATTSGVGCALIDVWYEYTAPCTGTATATLCAPPGSADFSVTLGGFSGDCGSLTLLDCNSFACGDAPEISFPVTFDETYYIQVGSAFGEQGSFTMVVDCNGVFQPNDFCSQATPIGEGFVSGSTVNATTDGPGCAAFDVWYRYTPSCSGVATASICSFGASFYATLGAYDGTCGDLTLLECDSLFCGDAPLVSFPVEAGKEYYLQVGSAFGEQGSFNLDVFCDPVCRLDFGLTPEDGGSPTPCPGTTTVTDQYLQSQNIVFGSAVDALGATASDVVVELDPGCSIGLAPCASIAQPCGGPCTDDGWWCAFRRDGGPAGVNSFRADFCSAVQAVVVAYDVYGNVVDATATSVGGVVEALTVSDPSGCNRIALIEAEPVLGGVPMYVDCLAYDDPEPVTVCPLPLAAVELARNSVVAPNPAQLLPGVTCGPVVGRVWDPLVVPVAGDVESAPGLLASLNPTDLPGILPPPSGTLLCDPTALFFQLLSQPTGLPLQVPIPEDCNLVGFSFCAQGGYLRVAPLPTTLQFTNALDVTIGTF
ncbi:MAG: hypothetical protein AAF682_13455 [Planctomycetota bacterium]